MPFLTHSGFNAKAENLVTGEKYDLKVAVDHAIKLNLPGVQLYLNDKVFSEDYLKELVAKIEQSALTQIVIHLPNFDNSQLEEFVLAARLLTYSLPPNISVRTLIHYGYEGDSKFLTAEQVPLVADNPVYIENSLTRVFDYQHVIAAARLAKEVGSGFVFDIGRFAYPKDTKAPFNPHQYALLVKLIIDLYSDCPEKLIIHTAGKNFAGPYRDHAVPHGNADDIFQPVYKYLLQHHARGGSIVFEAENPNDVEQSIQHFQTLAEV